ncbi:MAG: ATP-binding protein [Candidatus Hermodarchaeota archaeon]
MTEEVYQNLQKHLDQFPIGYPATKSGVEIRVLKHLFTPEEAKIATKMKWTFETVNNIHMNIEIQISVDELEKMLDTMVSKGLIKFKRKGEKKYYAIIPLVVGIYENQVNKLSKEFIEDFELYKDNEFALEIISTNNLQVRIIPLEQSLTPENQVASYDEIRKIIENTEEDSIGLANCICRQSKDLQGEPCSKTSERELCLHLGNTGRLFLDQGWARPISKDKALEILLNSEKNGLVLQSGNTKNPEFICICCNCCCISLSKAKDIPRPAQFLASNFYAEIYKELCIGCGTCLKRCQMNALKLVKNISKVNLKRCIGCGLCVSTCPEEAIHLCKKETEVIPPSTVDDLYSEIAQIKEELRQKMKK